MTSRIGKGDKCENPNQQLYALTDLKGVDFGPYLNRLRQTVKGNWYKLVPNSAMPPALKNGKVTIEFTILKDGRVEQMTMKASSGDIALDRAAWGGISASNPARPLPAEFPNEKIKLLFHFFYNPKTVIVSPSSEVQVATSSTLQLSATAADASDPSFTWSLCGDNCANSACGTISDFGLYTAPAKIPTTPPTVFVHVDLRSKAAFVGVTKITVIPSNTAKEDDKKWRFYMTDGLVDDAQF